MGPRQDPSNAENVTAADLTEIRRMLERQGADATQRDEMKRRFAQQLEEHNHTISELNKVERAVSTAPNASNSWRTT